MYSSKEVFLVYPKDSELDLSSQAKTKSLVRFGYRSHIKVFLLIFYHQLIHRDQNLN